MLPYNPLIMEHFRSPRNVGRPQGRCAVGEAENSVCLDRMKLYLVVVDGVVEGACFEADGCPPSIAAGSILTERIRGSSLADLATVDASRVETWMGGLPAGKKHASILAALALANAIRNIDHM